MRASSIICSGKLRAIDEAVEAWQNDHEEAMGVCDLETVILESKSLQDDILRHKNRLLTELFRTRMFPIIETGQTFLSLCEQFTRSLRRVAEVVQIATAAGYTVEGADGIPRIQLALDAAVDHFKAKWPFPDAAAIQRGRLDAAEGRVCDVEALLHGDLST